MFPHYKFPGFIFPRHDVSDKCDTGHASDIAVRDPEPRYRGGTVRGPWRARGNRVVRLEGICIRGGLVADGAVARLSPNTACVTP